MIGGVNIRNITIALLVVTLLIIAIMSSGCLSDIKQPGGATSQGSPDRGLNVYGLDDGSSGEGWTMNGASIDLRGMGNPLPAFKTNANQYMYKNIGLAPNMIVEFDAYISSQTSNTRYMNYKGDTLGDFYFLCDNTGKGNAVTLEGRQDYHSTSFIRTYNWTTWSYSDDSEFTVPTDQWVHVKIVLGDSTADLNVSYTDNKGNQWTFSQNNWAFDNKGGYVGFNGNGGSEHTVWWDNLIVYEKPTG